MVWGSSNKELPVDTWPYVPPVSPNHFATLWVLLLGAGIAFMGWFFVYEMTVSRSERRIGKEAALAVMSSLLLGFGFVFLALWSGLWL